MIKIKISEIIFWLVVLLIFISGLYGSYLLYTKTPIDNILYQCSALASFLLHIILLILIVIGLHELSKKSITINTNKIKQNLKQLIK